MTADKFVDILDSKIHFVEQGTGDPILFLHGIPTSSYIWRNIAPILADKARCIAPDLIGMGLSGKPSIEYTFFDHVDYIDEFIKSLDLKNITLVLHGLGAAVGLDYARRNEANVKAIAFYEPHLQSPSLKRENLLLQDWLHPLAENSEKARTAIIENSFFTDKFLAAFTLSSLDSAVLREYKKPYSTPADRQPLWQYLQDFALGENQPKVTQRVAAYSNWLTTTKLPKLLMYSNPGLMTSMGTVQWCKDNMPRLALADLEEGLHFEQESNPELFGQLLRDWYLTID
jgi:haloalkane dehalogenase